MSKLKDLILRYNAGNAEFTEAGENKTFMEILVIVDKLLLYWVWKFKKQYKFLRVLENQDLYQTSICSVSKAIKGVTPDFERTTIIKRLYGYVRRNILKKALMYHEKEKAFSYLPECFLQIYEETVDDSHVRRNLIMEDFFKKLEDMIESGEIKKKNLFVLYFRHYLDFSFKEIANIYGKSENSVKLIYHKTKKRISENLNKWDFLDGDTKWD